MQNYLTLKKWQEKKIGTQITIRKNYNFKRKIRKKIEQKKTEIQIQEQFLTFYNCFVI